MTAQQPSLSVVMPVHNALPHLDAAIRSILDQSYRDFEFVILDDASTDGSTERIREWAAADQRIRLIQSKRNLGPVGSSNLVVEQARAPLIARMDADDTCSPDRLEREFEILCARPHAGVVGTLYEVIDEHGRRLRGPESWRLTRRTPFVPFAHGSMMFRRTIFDQVGGYREVCEYWEDQDLVVRMSALADVLIIPLGLYQYRQWRRDGREDGHSERVENAVDLMYGSIARLEHSRSYDDLLQIGARPRRVDPRVFISLGSVVLWSGERPRFFGRLLKRGKLAPNFATVSTLVWTIWASFSPGSLRAFMSLLLRIRNGLAARKISTAAPLRWSPPAGVA